LFRNEDFNKAIWYTGDTATYYLTLTILNDQDRLDLYQYVRANSEWNPAIYPNLNLSIIIPQDVNIFSSNTVMNGSTGINRILPNDTPTSTNNRTFGPTPSLMVLQNRLTTGGFNGFPTNTKVTIYNNGLIVGAHGIGGAGGTSVLPSGINGSNGIRGGTAIYSDIIHTAPNTPALTVVNNGKILSGGGGGGGGAGMNWRPQTTVTTCYDSNTYSFSGATCKRRCGAGGDCPECPNSICVSSRCAQVGLNCRAGIRCSTYNYIGTKNTKICGPWGCCCITIPIPVLWVFTGVGCWTRCNVSTKRICNSELQPGTTYTGTGAAGGIGFGSGGALKPYPHTGSNWTFNGYSWFNAASNPDSVNYNGNLLAYEYVYSSGVDAGQPAPFETEPRFAPTAFGSRGGTGSVFGQPYEQGEYNRGKGRVDYDLAGFVTAAGNQGTGGFPGIAGYTFECFNSESSLNISLIIGSEISEYAAFGNVPRVLTLNNNALSWQTAPLLT
jgi:hypothetical protein